MLSWYHRSALGVDNRPPRLPPYWEYRLSKSETDSFSPTWLALFGRCFFVVPAQPRPLSATAPACATPALYLPRPTDTSQTRPKHTLSGELAGWAARPVRVAAVGPPHNGREHESAHQQQAGVSEQHHKRHLSASRSTRQSARHPPAGGETTKSHCADCALYFPE